jgi:hypothetical protein
MNDRIKLTESEKLSQAAVGTHGTMFNMSDDIDSLLEKEKAIKFNEQLSTFADTLEERRTDMQASAEKLADNFENVEIKPMFSRILIEPFKHNPFQRIEIKSGLIIDAGGYTPQVALNPNTGKYEEQEEFIITGLVIEVGPDTKYLQEGDVIFFRKDTAVPVPFLKQKLVSLAENQVIAVVNDSLTERFNKVNENGK